MTVPLPPLPDLGDDVFWEPTGPHLVDVLTAEHRQLGELSARLCSAPAHTPPPRQVSRLVDVLTAAVTRHLSAEEQYLYPSVRALAPDGDGLADAEIAADRALLRTLRELAGAAPDDPRFDRLARELAAALDRHARVAQHTLLPPLCGGLSEADLIRLGNRVQVAEEAAPTRPHPGTPAEPPWNKVVDPAIGVVDKARDLLARRATYPEDL